MGKDKQIYQPQSVDEFLTLKASFLYKAASSKLIKWNFSLCCRFAMPNPTHFCSTFHLKFIDYLAYLQNRGTYDLDEKCHSVIADT